MSESIDTHKHATLVVENLLKTTNDNDLDRIMLEAVEAGMESGRSIGVIEAYNFLIGEGYHAAAECLIGLIEEETEIRKSIADA